jgi:hypothetical protein
VVLHRKLRRFCTRKLSQWIGDTIPRLIARH